MKNKSDDFALIEYVEAYDNTRKINTPYWVGMYLNHVLIYENYAIPDIFLPQLLEKYSIFRANYICYEMDYLQLEWYDWQLPPCSLDTLGYDISVKEV